MRVSPRARHALVRHPERDVPSWSWGGRVAFGGQTRKKEIKKKKKKDVLLVSFGFPHSSSKSGPRRAPWKPCSSSPLSFFWESWMEGWHCVLAIPALLSSPRVTESPACCRRAFSWRSGECLDLERDLEPKEGPASLVRCPCQAVSPLPWHQQVASKSKWDCFPAHRMRAGAEDPVLQRWAGVTQPFPTTLGDAALPNSPAPPRAGAGRATPLGTATGWWHNQDRRTRSSSSHFSGALVEHQLCSVHPGECSGCPSPPRCRWDPLSPRIVPAGASLNFQLAAAAASTAPGAAGSGPAGCQDAPDGRQEDAGAGRPGRQRGAPGAEAVPNWGSSPLNPIRYCKKRTSEQERAFRLF